MTVTTGRGSRLAPPLAAAVVLAAAGPAAACDSTSGGFLDWNACWCGYRLLLFAVGGVVAWGIAFHQIFPNLLDPSRAAARWPRDAFRLAAVVFWLLWSATFLVLFAAVSDELRQRIGLIPGAGSGGPLALLNKLWVLVLAGCLLVAVLVWAFLKPRRARP